MHLEGGDVGTDETPDDLEPPPPTDFGDLPVHDEDLGEGRSSHAVRGGEPLKALPNKIIAAVDQLFHTIKPGPCAGRASFEPIIRRPPNPCQTNRAPRGALLLCVKH